MISRRIGWKSRRHFPEKFALHCLIIVSFIWRAVSAWFFQVNDIVIAFQCSVKEHHQNGRAYITNTIQQSQFLGYSEYKNNFLGHWLDHMKNSIKVFVCSIWCFWLSAASTRWIDVVVLLKVFVIVELLSFAREKNCRFHCSFPHERATWKDNILRGTRASINDYFKRLAD
jgi:hypothetical protein